MSGPNDQHSSFSACCVTFLFHVIPSTVCLGCFLPGNGHYRKVESRPLSNDRRNKKNADNEMKQLIGESDLEENRFFGVQRCLSESRKMTAKIS